MAIWKLIKDYETLYEISDNGEIKSKVTNELLSKWKHNKTEYYCVSLYKKPKAKSFYVHRLVATAFIDNPDNKRVVDHINNNKLDNTTKNLRWVTHKENMDNYYVNHYKPKKREIIQYDLNNKIIKEWENIQCIMQEHKEYNITNIYHSLYDNNKNAHGYKWRYKNKIRVKNNTFILNDNEIFKNIGIINNNDYSNYEISDHGNIKNVKLNKILSPGVRKDGYKETKLTDTNTQKLVPCLVHRLVALIFIGNPTDVTKIYINHKDKDRTNNHIDNLEWVTPRQNNIHSSGRKVHQLDPKTGEILKTFDSIADAGNSFNKTPSNIFKSIKNGTSIIYGYKWKYADN